MANREDPRLWAGAAARVTALAAAEEEITTLVRSIGDADQRRKQATQRLEELSRLAERMPDAAMSEAVTARSIEARRIRAARATEHDEVHALMATAEQELRSPEHAALRSRIDEAGPLLARLDAQHGAVEAAVAQHQAGLTRVDKAGAELAEATAKAEATEAALAEADAES